MKRRSISLIVILMLSTPIFSQDSLTGYYRSTGPTHLLLDEGQRFYIIAYATFIRGHWNVENNQIKLVPDNPEHSFELYGRYNPNIKDGYKIKFNNFERKQTFIGSGSTDTMQRIFNLHPNCFNHPYIIKYPVKAASISFVDALEPGIPEYRERRTHTFTTGKYNDFIAVYNDHSRLHKIITLRIEQQPGQFTLINANGQFKKIKMDEKLQREIYEIRDFAKKEMNVNDTYCNPSYRPFDTSSMNFEANYAFDSAKNAWVSKFNYEKDEEIYPEKKDDPYHSTGILYKYEKIVPTNITFKPFKIYEKSLFTVKCNDQD